MNGEKSCLKYASYFGIDNDISVAVCGSNLTNYQVQLLKSLDVEEIVIAFDKQWRESGDNEFKGWVKKLREINKKYSSIIQISFLFDKWNLLGYKDSPIDCRTWNFYTIIWKESNGIVDEKIKEYRTNHQKCKWCKYYKYRSPSTKIMGLNCPDYEECVLKDKIIHFTNKRNMCLYYELKEESNEV